MVDTLHQFNNVQVGGFGGSTQGHLRLHGNGASWRSSSGGKPIEIKRDEITGVVWTRTSKGFQLGLKRTNGTKINFQGFREADIDTVRKFSSGIGHEIIEQAISASGRNWGKVEIDGKMVTFKVGDNSVFDVPLPDVTSAQQSKDEVMLEFPFDDTQANDMEDSLVGLSFHIPEDNNDFGDEGDGPPSKRFLDKILQYTDAGAGNSDEAVATFDEVAILVPRGRFEVQMHLSFLKLLGQTQDYKIKYSSIMRLFVLPRSNPPQTLVAISLDPPIRKGQTYYNHILCQFATDDNLEIELDISDDALSAKNDKCNGKLDAKMEGSAFDVFAKCLRGLSGAKLTRPQSFKNNAGDGHAIRCSYRADEGYLYPLERAFFYIHKPPLLITHDEIDSVEFQRQGVGVVSGSAKTFDLLIRTRSETEHQFRGIQRTEWQNLFDFIKHKELRIENLKSVLGGPGGGRRGGLDIGDEYDPGFHAANMEESDESDSDFKMTEDEGGDGSSDGGSSSSGDVEIVNENEISNDESGEEGGDDDAMDVSGGVEVHVKPPKKSEAKKVRKEFAGAPKKRSAAAADSVPVPKKTKAGKEGGSEKPARKKKDKDAPKKNLSPYMFFANENRAKVKEENPGIAFGDVAKLLGEKWKEVSKEDKEKYEKMAGKDKIRYKEEMAVYKEKKAKEAAAAGAGDD